MKAKWPPVLKRILTGQAPAQGMIEYGLIIALVAIVAVAHKLARIVYAMLKYRTEYKDPGDDYYDVKYRERAVRNLKRKAKQLGYAVVPVSA